jgi:hypothetical protein
LQPKPRTVFSGSRAIPATQLRFGGHIILGSVPVPEKSVPSLKKG